MNCEEIRGKLDDYIDSEILSDEERAEIQAHLEKCEECRREYEDMVKIKEELKKLADVELPKQFHKNLMKQIRKTNTRKEPFFKKNYKWVTAVAAVLIIGVFTTAGILVIPTFKSSTMEQSAISYDMAMAEAPRESGENKAFGSDAEFDFAEEMGVVSTGMTAEDGASVSPETTAEGTDERKIIKTVYVEMDTEDIEAAFNTIGSHVEGIGGFVEYSNIGDVVYGYYEKTQASEEMRYASINARVPQEQLNEIITFIENLGVTRSKTLNTTDRSDYYYDVESQIANLEAREDRLRDLMESAEDISDVIEVERELSRVRTEIDGLTRNLRYIDKDVDYSTVSIQMREVMSSSKINTEERNIFTEAKEGLIQSINKLLNFLQSAFVWMVSSLPIFLTVLLGLWIIFGIIKKVRIKRIK
jgi:hypothetical protein